MKIAKPKPRASVKSREDMPSIPGHCGTCVKIRQVHSAKYECTALNVMLGCEEECWAWSGDPDWWEKTERKINEYNGKWWKKWRERKE